MNDIETLEKLIKEFDEFKEKQKLNVYILTNKEKQALENLIARNKELEEENWIMRTVDKQYISKDKIKEDYIPKSKVKEVLDITATVLGDKYELDYQDIQDVIAETISKIKQELLQ